MRHLVFLVVAAGRIAAQKVVDFPLGNDDLAFDLALADAGNGDFLADFLAETGEGNPVTLQGIAELGQ